MSGTRDMRLIVQYFGRFAAASKAAATQLITPASVREAVVPALASAGLARTKNTHFLAQLFGDGSQRARIIGVNHARSMSTMVAGTTAKDEVLSALELRPFGGQMRTPRMSMAKLAAMVGRTVGNSKVLSALELKLFEAQMHAQHRAMSTSTAKGVGNSEALTASELRRFGGQRSSSAVSSARATNGPTGTEAQIFRWQRAVALSEDLPACTSAESTVQGLPATTV